MALCMMCAHPIYSDQERVQNKLGPLTFWFCSEKCEMLYWHLRNTSVDLYKWLRKPPGSRGSHLLSMRPHELAHAKKCIRVLSKNGRAASEARPPHCLRITYN